MCSTWKGKSVTDWQKKWGVPLLEAHESLPSTNSRARELLETGVAPFSTVIAETQTEGRGRNGNNWFSPKGMGLWMSFVLRDVAKSSAKLIPTLAGLAVLDALEKASGSSRLGIKWPNDIEADGRKIAGILCETFRKDSAVVGIGINLTQSSDDFKNLSLERAGSVAMATGRVLEPSGITGSIIAHCKDLLNPLPTILNPELVEKLKNKSTLVGTRVLLTNGLEGSVVGFSPLGAMLVMVQESLYQINSTGDIRRYIPGSNGKAD